MLLPFKAYVVVVLLLSILFSSALRLDGTALWLLIGCAVSCLALLFGLVAYAVRGHRWEAIGSALFVALGILLSWRLLPYLAR